MIRLLKQLIMAIAIFSNGPPLHAQDDPTYLLLPTEEVEINSGLIASLTDEQSWKNSFRAYTSTSEKVLNAWCNDLSPESPAIAMSTLSIDEAEFRGCPSIDTGYTMSIQIPLDSLPPNYAKIAKSDEDTLYLYLRTQDDASFRDLSGLGKGLLVSPFSSSGSDVFSVGRQSGLQEEFFPNFCQMCGCCTNSVRR